MEPALPDVFYCLLAWSCPQVFNSGLGMGLCEGMFDKELFSCRIFGISKLLQTQKSFWHRFKANSFWKNSSDSYEEVFRSDENFFLFWFWWKCEEHEVTSSWSQKVWISIWGLLRTIGENVKNTKWHLVDHERFKFQFEGYWEPLVKIWKTQSDIWLVTKRFKFQFEGYWEPFSKHLFYLHE